MGGLGLMTLPAATTFFATSLFAAAAQALQESRIGTLFNVSDAGMTAVAVLARGRRRFTVQNPDNIYL